MKRSFRGVNSFFIEIVIVICFFSISAVVILQLFAAAGSRAQQSRDLSVAVIKAQDIAEQIRGLSSLEELSELPETEKTTSPDGGDHFKIDYDKQWNQTQSAPRYAIGVSLKKNAEESGVLVDAEISVFRCESSGEKKIFTLNTAKYLPVAP